MRPVEWQSSEQDVASHWRLFPRPEKKRKQEAESSQRSSKRPRPSLMVGDPPKAQLRSCRLSRTHRLKQRGVSEGPARNITADQELKNDTDTCHPPEIEPKCEDALWTDKYRPRCSSEVIGNSVAVDKLHSWLKKWKLRADGEEKGKTEERMQKPGTDLWDCGDFQGEAGDGRDGVEPPCNAMLLTGPPGVGKTASVYACAQELGFKVLEVNCSSRRSGRRVLSQLKEATQSHLVETPGHDPPRPAYFNSYGLLRKDTGPGGSAAPKNIRPGARKQPTRRFGSSAHKREANPAAVTLANYFKAKARVDHLHSGGLSSTEKPDSRKSGERSPACVQTESHNPKNATSLILFEEVDVVFQEDVGFLAAVEAFATTTKRPVVLTTNDPTVRERFGCRLEEIRFKTLSAVSAGSFLQRVCLTESVTPDSDDASGLPTLARGDLRRCLLQLQFWARSTRQHSGLNEKPQVPSCDSGCAISMLGLHPVSQTFLRNILKSWTEADAAKLSTLLIESWRRDVPLLYTNLELLLPTSGVAASSELQGPPRLLPMNVSLSNKLSLGKRNRPAAATDRERCAAELVTDYLSAIGDFFDLMSYLDAALAGSEQRAPAPCGQGFIWTGGELKDGTVDQMGELEVRIFSQERLLELHAAVEGLGVRSCWARVSEMWTEARRCKRDLGDTWWRNLVEKLPISTSSKMKSLSLGHRPLCAPGVLQRRYKIGKSVLSSRPFSLLGNRQAVCVDYMPLLRSISCSQRQPRVETDRCLTHLSSIHIHLSKSTLQLLAEDFLESSPKIS